MKSAVLLICILASYASAEEHLGRCDDLSCVSRDELLDMIRVMQKEKQDQATGSSEVSLNKFWESKDAADTPGCTICASNPCLNGGTCVADKKYPFSRYTCVCPANYGGNYCQNVVKCTANSCGTGANCFVSNHQINCVCPPGFSGNPKVKCSTKISQACTTGDPHYVTYDGLRFDYQGTCAYDFSVPCFNNTVYDFRVIGKNEFVPGTKVSTPSEVQVNFPKQQIHIDGKTNRVYVNGIITNVPYYYPSSSVPKITIKYGGGYFRVSNDQYITVKFIYGSLCVSVPSVPELTGPQGLCGLAGNIDGNYKNDVVIKGDLTVFPVDSHDMPTTKSNLGFNKAEDSWITTEFLPDATCIRGEILANNTKCDVAKAVPSCEVIQQAATGTGSLAACSPLGNETIQSWYGDCLFDVCHGSDRCGVLLDFVRFCQTNLPNANLITWRDNTNCLPNCPLNSHYSSCTSSCPASCANQFAPDFCEYGCSDGCECDVGYVIDNTNLKKVTCIPVEDCGCTDPTGNFHAPNTPWLTANCAISAECRNGTYYSKVNYCSQYATCGINPSGDLSCMCLPGFTGDGYTCTDINECLDPNTCGASTGNGVCTNTIGSYNCSCNTYFSGRDCQHYLPNRHCADIYKYQGQIKSGVYTINPPFAYNNKPAFTPLEVYCNMDLENNGAIGGWTLMSHDSSDKMSNKSYAEYQVGFGTAASGNVWLGLDVIHGMTAEISTSLYVYFYQCSSNGIPAKNSYCNYKKFFVDDAKVNYQVTIPETCQGSAADFKDGWARWKLSEPGPTFIAYDNDPAPNFCSKTFQNTGFWYDTSVRCGAADLNGVRYTCTNIPDDSTESTYLYWNGSPMADAWLYLRPSNYPNYDNHKVTY